MIVAQERGVYSNRVILQIANQSTVPLVVRLADIGRLSFDGTQHFQHVGYMNCIDYTGKKG